MDGANRHDMQIVRATIESLVGERREPSEEEPQAMCLDKGYDDDAVREILAEFGFTAHIKARGAEAKELKAKAGKRARRRVVERSHSWMNRFRLVPLPSSRFVLPRSSDRLRAYQITLDGVLRVRG